MTLRESATYGQLRQGRHILAFDLVDSVTQEAVLNECRHLPDKPEIPQGAQVFRVEALPLITYPWEWPDAMLRKAGLLTLELRHRLLEIGLDLKDAAAPNIQFRGVIPTLMDLGSIQTWRPNPSWNALRQFVEQFVNPLAVGTGHAVTAADAWAMSRGRGLRVEPARQMLPGRARRDLNLRILQAATRPTDNRKPVEKEFGRDSTQSPDLALSATVSLTKRLRKRIVGLHRSTRATTWSNYSERAHYSEEALQRKVSWTMEAVSRLAHEGDTVLDIGGNDGLIATSLSSGSRLTTVVLDADPGALDGLCTALDGDPEMQGRVLPLYGDITNLTENSGLLGEEFSAFVSRVRPTVVICQAVLHHIVITQGIPLKMALAALARFGVPTIIEFATEEDPKVKLLQQQIPNWSGTYSWTSFESELRASCARVSVIGQTAPTRVLLEADW